MGGGKITKDEIVAALGYEPVGGQGVNLIAGTGTPTTIYATASQYQFANFKFTVGKLITSKTYTLSANIDVLSGDVNSIRATITRDGNNSWSLQSTEINAGIENNRITGQFTITGNDATRLLIYAGIPGSTANNSIRISNLKLEPGIVTNPIWTPALEDLAMQSDYEALAARVAALEAAKA